LLRQRSLRRLRHYGNFYFDGYATGRQEGKEKKDDGGGVKGGRKREKKKKKKKKGGPGRARCVDINWPLFEREHRLRMRWEKKGNGKLEKRGKGRKEKKKEEGERGEIFTYIVVLYRLITDLLRKKKGTEKGKGKEGRERKGEGGVAIPTDFLSLFLFISYHDSAGKGKENLKG